MILIALGANLPTERFGEPRAACEAALAELEARGIRVVRRSRWYRSRPVPPSGQPDYVNGVVAVETTLDPRALLAELHSIEAAFGRERREKGAARTLDLDLIAYHERVSDGGAGEPVLPHPRLASRAFVLRPLSDVAPDWRHPASGRTLAELLADLDPEAPALPL
ncbi:MAG TPA: 2-amino-4-hydroxy-6-hydroxymethyldihydropteridine diphosphokinase [Alphaproteobacteria bacterium]|nr:2-amino-4-hydroxy-6-hydroxymethyldihydropteridine diphosphokinase [Alphaproteobacteria bacterium]